MKLHRRGAIAVLAMGAVLTMAACGSDNSGSGGSDNAAKAPNGADCEKGSLTAQGSTAQANAMAEWIKAYQTKCKGAKITYGSTGSGAGVEAFTAGTADFAGSDSALADGTEQNDADKRCTGGEALDLPMVTGPIAVVYNLSGVSGLQFKPATLAGIFSGKIKKWNDPKIQADNPTVKNLPSSAILPVHRSDESGTTDNFTNYLTETAKGDWTYDHDKTWKAPGGVGQKGSDGVAAKVKATQGTIAYIEWSYATTDALTMAKIYNGSGQYTELTAAAAGNTVSGAQVVGQGNNLKLSIDYSTKTSGAYPIVLVTYEIVCSKGNDKSKIDLLKSFMTYIASDNGQSQLTKQGYAPLPSAVQSKVQAAIKTLS